jgi:hypothetical protein
MRTLLRHKIALAASVALAVIAAVWSVYRISLSPPHLSQRSLEMASAVSHVIVDTPNSIIVDLRANTYAIESLTSRAVVLGNVIASTPIEAAIAQRAHVPVGLLRIQAPLTTQEASLQVTPQNTRHISDILKSNDQYRIQIVADPTVPMLDIYAQTPNAASAAALANAAVYELKSYVAGLAQSDATPEADQIRLRPLGTAKGTVINPGIQYQVAVLAFVLTFAAAAMMIAFLDRNRDRWGFDVRKRRPAGA